MQSCTTLLTAAAILIHTLLGCSWHHSHRTHAHACGGLTCCHANSIAGEIAHHATTVAGEEEVEPSLAEQEACDCDEVCSCANHEAVPSGTIQMGIANPLPGGHCPCRLACEADCTGLRPQKLTFDLAQQWLQIDQITFAPCVVTIAPRGTCSFQRLADEPPSGPPIRLHLWNQILLI